MDRRESKGEENFCSSPTELVNRYASWLGGQILQWTALPCGVRLWKLLISYVMADGPTKRRLTFINTKVVSQVAQENTAFCAAVLFTLCVWTCVWITRESDVLDRGTHCLVLEGQPHSFLTPFCQDTAMSLINIWKWKRKLPSCVWLFATPWIVQSMEFSRPEYWSGLPSPSPGDLPTPGIEPMSPTWQVDSSSPEPQGKPRNLLSI